MDFAQHAGDEAAMNKGRLEAFSDGVIAIIITIMVLELKVPHGDDLAALQPLLPVLLELRAELHLCRHLLEQPPPHVACQPARERPVLWANLHLLFWLSLMPFVTGWMGENHFARMPVALYGVVLLMCAIAYTILVRCLIAVTAPTQISPAPSVTTARATSRSCSTAWVSHWRSSTHGSRLDCTWGRRCGSFPTGESRKRSRNDRRPPGRRRYGA